jgi:hypothetical protein
MKTLLLLGTALLLATAALAAPHNGCNIVGCTAQDLADLVPAPVCPEPKCPQPYCPVPICQTPNLVPIVKFEPIIQKCRSCTTIGGQAVCRHCVTRVESATTLLKQ